jgi:hypothetical protein
MEEMAESFEEIGTTAGHLMYDDAALERMLHRFSSYDDLLRYVKRYGMHRHFEHENNADP